MGELGIFQTLYFLATFLAGFFATFLAAGFFATGFLATFLAAGFFAAFLTGFFTFLAAGFFATFLGFFAFFLTTFLTFLTFFTFSTLGSLKDALTWMTFLAANIFLTASLTRTCALAASATLLLAMMYLRMALRDEPPRSLRAAMAAATMTAYGGCAAFTAGFFALGATFLAGAASAMVLVELLEWR